MKFRQSKGNNSVITDNTPIKLHVHNLIMVTYIQFHELPSIGYLVMVEDRKTDRWVDGETGRTYRQCQTNIPPPPEYKTSSFLKNKQKFYESE